MVGIIIIYILGTYVFILSNICNSKEKYGGRMYVPGCVYNFTVL